MSKMNFDLSKINFYKYSNCLKNIKLAKSAKIIIFSSKNKDVIADSVPLSLNWDF